MPAEDFIPIARIEKVQLSAANGNNYHAREIIWTNRQTYEKLPPYMKEAASYNMAEQTTLFDFLGGDA